MYYTDLLSWSNHGGKESSTLVWMAEEMVLPWSERAKYLQYVLLYQFLQMLPLGDALAITGTAPFFTAIFSVFLLQERMKYMEITAGIVAMAGVLLIARPESIFGKYGTKSEVPHMNIYSSDYELTYLLGCLIVTFFQL